jgi:ABC-2 type transport system permease protein
MMPKLIALARKDVQLFFADKKAMMISFLVPIFIGSFFSMVMGGSSSNSGPKRLTTLVVIEDSSTVTASILEDLRRSEALSLSVVKRDEAIAKVKAGDVSVAVIFGKGFGDQAKQALFVGDVPKLEVLFDPSKGIERQVVQGALMQSVMSKVSQAGMSGDGALTNLESAVAAEGDPTRKQAWKGFLDSWKSLNQTGGLSDTSGQGQGMKQPFEIDAKPLSASADPDAENRSSKAHIFAGMAVQGTLFFGIDAAMALLRDKRTGIWSRLRAAPISSSTLLLGRGLGSWLIASMILTGVFAFGILGLGIRVQGSWPGMIAVGAAAALMTATFGLFVASLGKTEAQSRGLSVLAVLMMSMLGGAWFPTWMMPDAMQKVSMLVPVRWAVDGFDAMSWRGMDFAHAINPVLGLAVFSFIFATIAAARFRKA